MEAAVLCVHLLPCPVLQLDHQFIVPLFPQVVDIVQSKPVLTVYVSKAPLIKTKKTNEKNTIYSYVITLKLWVTFKWECSLVQANKTQKEFKLVAVLR